MTIRPGGTKSNWLLERLGAGWSPRWTLADVGTGRDRRNWASLIGLTIVVVTVLLVVIGLGGIGQIGSTGESGTSDDLVDRGQSPGSDGDDLGSPARLPAGPLPISDDALASSIVELLGIDSSGNVQCSGSGIVMTVDGAILTNASVVTSSSECAFDRIGVAINSGPDQPAVLRYFGEVAAVDPSRNLAVLRPSEPIDDAPWPPDRFTPAPRGDSDTVTVGQTLRIFGYPATLALAGVDVVAASPAQVVAVVNQVGLGPRALLRVESEAAAGSSGGPVVTVEGLVVGLAVLKPGSPTSVRPLNEARDVLSAAGALQPFEGSNEAEVDDGEGDTERYDLSNVRFSNPRFSVGQDDAGTVDEVLVGSAGMQSLCLYLDWEGVPLGVPWTGAWYRDGLPIEGQQFTGNRWESVDDRQDFFLCADSDEPEGLQAGTYEFGLVLQEETQFVEVIELLDEAVEPVLATWLNETETEICGFAANPVGSFGHFGLDIMPVDQSIPPGGEWSVLMAPGRQLVETYDCDGDVVANEPDGVLVSAEDLRPFVLRLPDAVDG